MRKSFAFLAVAVVWAVAVPAYAQAPTQVQIVVHESSGDKSFTAPVVGQAPVSLEEAMKGAGMTFTATWFPSVPGYAAMIIGGEPAQTTGGFSTPFWWACINGYSSAAGLQTFVKSGDQVEWFLLSEGKCAKDSAK